MASDDETGQGEQLSDALERSVEEGTRRIERSWPALISTGVVGGLDVGVGVLAFLVVKAETGSTLLGAVAFTVGFVALILSGSELFTEDFLVPVVTLWARRSVGVVSVLRLWGATLGANLVGGWVVMALIIAALPDVRVTAVDAGRQFPELGLGTALASGLLAGMVMTLLTWLEHMVPSVVAQLTAAVAAGFVLLAAPLNHAVVGALEMSGALVAGAPFGYAEALLTLAWASLANAVGGIGLVTVVRLVQVGNAPVQKERSRER